MFVGSNKRLVAQLQLQVDSQSFDSVPHTVGGRHARQILQKVRQCPLVWRLFAEVLVVAHIAFRLDLRQLFASLRICVLRLLGGGLTDAWEGVERVLGRQATRMGPGRVLLAVMLGGWEVFVAHLTLLALVD